MRRTIDVMQKGLAHAVVELRRRMRWSQSDLADQIKKHSARAGIEMAPDHSAISGWERREHAPSSTHRMILARIAAKHEHEDLAEMFRAPVSAWRLAGRVTKLTGDGEAETETP